MTRVQELYDDMIAAMNVEGLEIPVSCVKFYKQGDSIPEAVTECIHEGVTLTSSAVSSRRSAFSRKTPVDSGFLSPDPCLRQRR